MLPRAVRHKSTRRFVDDLQFVISHEVMSIAFHEVKRCERLPSQFITPPAAQSRAGAGLEDLQQSSPPGIGQLDQPLALADIEIGSEFQFRDGDESVAVLDSIARLTVVFGND